MELNSNIYKLIADIEYIIGKECYNPNSYDGWNDVEGCDFRYPITTTLVTGESHKFKENINESLEMQEGKITSDSIQYMKYKFGSNELFIGLGILHVLEYLEKRYGINFNELHEQHPVRSEELTEYVTSHYWDNIIR